MCDIFKSTRDKKEKEINESGIGFGVKKMALLGPKKDGGPNVEFFQSPEIMQGFEQVRQWLQKNCKRVSILRRVSRHSSYI